MALIDASTKIPLAEPKVLVNEYEVLSMRTIVRQARTNLGGHARLHKVVCDQGFWDGVELWCLEPGEITFVVPAKEHMAMTTDVRA